MPNEVISLPLGKMEPDSGAHRGGLISVRGFYPWPGSGYAPSAILFRDNVGDLGSAGMVTGAHVHFQLDKDNLYKTAAGIFWTDGSSVYFARLYGLRLSQNVEGTTNFDGSRKVGAFFTSFGNFVIGTGDKLQYLDIGGLGGASFADLVTSADKPASKFIATAGSRIVIAGIIHGGTSAATVGADPLYPESPDLVWFSAVDDPATFSDGSSGDGSEFAFLKDDLGVITGIATLADGFGFVFKQRGIYRFNWQESPVRFELVKSDIGTISPQSIVASSPYVYFWDSRSLPSRVSQSGWEDLSLGQASRPLLGDEHVYQGAYPADDPSHPGERWVGMFDIKTHFGDTSFGSGVGTLYPVGAYDSASDSVRWVYPGLKGAGTVDQRWIELCYSIQSASFSFSDITYCRDGASIDKVDAHWIVGYPGVGLLYSRPDPSATTLVSYDFAPRDVFYAAVSPSSAFYVWSRTINVYDPGGYPWLDPPALTWGFRAPGNGNVLKIRITYTERQFGLEEFESPNYTVRILTKRVSGDDAGVWSDNSTTVNQRTATLDSEGFASVACATGAYHQIFVSFDTSEQIPIKTISLVEAVDIIYARS